MNPELNSGEMLPSKLQFSIDHSLSGAYQLNRILSRELCDDMRPRHLHHLPVMRLIFPSSPPGVGVLHLDPAEPLITTSCLPHRRQLRCVFKGQLPGPTVQVLDMLRLRPVRRVLRERRHHHQTHHRASHAVYINPGRLW